MFTSALRNRLVNSAKSLTMTKRYAHAPVTFNWEDPLDSASLFTEDELAIQETAKSYCQERMLPRVLGMSSMLTFHTTHCSFKQSQRHTEMSIMTAKSWKKWGNWGFWGLQYRVMIAQALAVSLQG